MYWCDAGTNRVEVADLNGQSRRALATITNVDIHPFDIGIFNNDIYWSDWALTKIVNMNRHSPDEVTAVGEPVFTKAGGIYTKEGNAKLLKAHNISEC